MKFDTKLLLPVIGIVVAGELIKNAIRYTVLYFSDPVSHAISAGIVMAAILTLVWSSAKQPRR
jgi:hypothetical protein